MLIRRDPRRRKEEGKVSPNVITFAIFKGERSAGRLP